MFVLLVFPVAVSSSLVPSGAALVASSVAWGRCQFFRSGPVGRRFWVLSGVPLALAERVSARLFLRGCRAVGCPVSFSLVGGVRLVSFSFVGPVEFAAELALLFPAPLGCAPLSVSACGSRVLFGAAARSRSAVRQRVAALALPVPSSPLPV